MLKKIVIVLVVISFSVVDISVGQNSQDAVIASRLSKIRNAQRQRNAAQARTRARQKSQQQFRKRQQAQRQQKANTRVVKPRHNGKGTSHRNLKPSSASSTQSWYSRAKASATSSYRTLSKSKSTYVRRIKAINRLSRMNSNFRYAKQVAQREGISPSKQLTDTFRNLKRRDTVNKWKMVGSILTSGRFFKTKAWQASKQVRKSI